MRLPVLARTGGVPVSLCLRWPGASSTAKLRPALTWQHSSGSGANFSSSPSAAAPTRRAPAPPALSWRREFTPEAEQVLMRTVRHFCERLEFAKTGIPTTIHGNLKPYLPLLPPSSETAGAEEVVTNVAEAQPTGAKKKRHARKIDKYLATLKHLRIDKDKEAMAKARYCLQTYLDQLFAHGVGDENVDMDRAKARLQADQASQIVYRWICRPTARYRIGHNINESQ
ncbi:hypothetical protein PG988_005951 [Apiospora saccharicola]